jgi:hypothetical protein
MVTAGGVLMQQRGEQPVKVTASAATVSGQTALLKYPLALEETELVPTAKLLSCERAVVPKAAGSIPVTTLSNTSLSAGRK